MVYRQNVLQYRCASMNFEEVHSGTVPATAKATEVAANYAGKKNHRLVKLTTYDGKTIRNFERSARPQDKAQ